MSFTAAELQGTSFWDRLCQDSVRSLKSAFMDSLAARQPDSDTAPLGSGLWELRLVDKDGSTQLMTLNGVVQFSGDRPECVCSIRPCNPDNDLKSEMEAVPTMARASVSLGTDSLRRESRGYGHGGSNVAAARHHKSDWSNNAVMHGKNKGCESFRISDSGNSSGSGGSNSSVESESGSNSCDEANA
jgi:hypothetical protein